MPRDTVTVSGTYEDCENLTMEDALGKHWRKKASVTERYPLNTASQPLAADVLYGADAAVPNPPVPELLSDPH